MSQKYYIGILLITYVVIPAAIVQADNQVSISRPPEDEIFYFIIPDRFLDGNPNNNYGEDTKQGFSREDVLRHGYLPTDKGYYHGGDLRGVLMQLPYLRDLGITAIWLSPVFKNKPVQPDPHSQCEYGHSAAYHGYWVLDFLQVDPHLGTNQDLRDLIQEAHRRGIKVYLDIITNHTADVIRLEPWDETDHRDIKSYLPRRIAPYRNTTGGAFDESLAAFYGNTKEGFPEMSENGFPYRPVIAPEERVVKNPLWLNDPLNYHNRGDAIFNIQTPVDEQDRSESLLYGDFAGLDDFFTEKPEVVKGMIEIYGHWIKEYLVDGFRIDTARHVNVEFWRAFAPKMKEVAKEAGIGHFFAFGEISDARPEFLSFFTTTAKLQGVLDFGFQKAAMGFASKSRPTDDLRIFFEQDDYYTNQCSNICAMPTFLGNHDMGRIGYFLKVDNPDASDEELVARSILAHAMMFFARGTPVIYYGDEQGFIGDGGDKDAREDMFPSKVAVYNDNKLIGSLRSTSEMNFDPTHPIRRVISSMAAIRLKYPGIRKGSQIHRYSSNEAGIYAFSRIATDEKHEYVIAMNNNSMRQAMEVSIPTYSKSTVFDIVFQYPWRENTQLRSDDKKKISVSLPRFGVIVMRARTRLQQPARIPKIFIAGLNNGQVLNVTRHNDSGYQVPDRIEVRAELDTITYGDVTFNVIVAGEQIVTLGTDTAPPFRIFFDPSIYPEGSTLSLRATFKDTFGGSQTITVKNLKVGR